MLKNIKQTPKLDIDQFFKHINDEASLHIDGIRYEMNNGVAIQIKDHSTEQSQTSAVYEYMWEQTQEDWCEEAIQHNLNTQIREYPSIQEHIASLPEKSIVLDLGCGSGFSAYALFREQLANLNYYGVEISDGIFHARKWMDAHNNKGHYLKGDIAELPFLDNQADIILCTGVLQHTDSVDKSIASLARILKPKGTGFVNCYKKPAPIRAFSDKFINSHVKDLPIEEIKSQLDSLTQFGMSLGQNKAEIDVPADIEILGIPKGSYPLQQFFFDYVFKAYFHEHLNENQLGFMNYDWYSPKNCHQLSEDEFSELLVKHKLKIEKTKETGTFISAVVTKEV
tara:strand:- start:17451 stop:18467 length:1017 start_codon:yes stop_codon:yes gene_type:complete